MARSIRENEKFPPSSIAVFLEHLPAKTGADLRFEEEKERSSELMNKMKDAKLTRCEFIYLKEVCNFGNSELESFCRGRKYNPGLQVPTIKTGPYSQMHAVLIRNCDGDFYRRVVQLIRRADRYRYDGGRIEPTGPFPRGWKDQGKDDRLIDMLAARESLDEILAGPLFPPQQKQEDVA